MKKIFYLASIAIAAMVIGCTPAEEEGNINKEEYTPAALTVEPEALNVAKTAGATATATVTSDSEVLSADVDYAAASWLSAKLEGTTLTVTTTAANTNPQTRQGIVYVHAGVGINTTTVSVTVTQALEDEIAPTIALGGKEAKLTGAKDALAIISYESNMTDVTVAVAEDGKAWLKAEKGDKNITLTALSDNESGAERSTTVTVTAKNTKGSTVSETIAVTQAQKPAEGTIGIGSIVENGVLFWISEDGKTGKVVAGPRADGAAAKVSEDKTSVDGASSKDDGLFNTDAVKAVDPTFAKHPAFKFCADMGEGWYLPALREAYSLFAAYCGVAKYEDVEIDVQPGEMPAEMQAARAFFDNQLLSLKDGQKLDGVAKVGESVFTSSESESGNAFYVIFGKRSKNDNTGAKNSTSRTARCIKVVNL
ncbi:MAG: BACON domain-containing protein [Tidjanibacter sp.]|nr:BACON domain-containing protein [Tidjanibacter sp.]